MLCLFLLASCTQGGSTSAPATAAPTETAPTAVQTPLPTNLIPIYEVTMFTGGEGWATDVNREIIYHTMDFGEHWTVVTPTDLPVNDGGYVYNNTVFLNPMNAWLNVSQIEGGSVQFHSADRGLTWIQTDLPVPGGQMAFVSEEEGYMLSSLGVGAGSQYVALYHTQDAGATWQEVFSHEDVEQDPGLPAGGIKSDFMFLGTDIGFVSGSEPVSQSLYLFRTEDGGVSWQQQECGGLPVVDENDIWNVAALHKVNNSTAVVEIRAYVSSSDKSLTYYCGTEDAGETWTYKSTLNQVEFSDFGRDGFGLAYGNGSLFSTEDGGAIWTESSALLPIGMPAITMNILSPGAAYLVVSLPEPVDAAPFTQNRIFVTYNYGASWQPVPGDIIE